MQRFFLVWVVTTLLGCQVEPDSSDPGFGTGFGSNSTGAAPDGGSAQGSASSGGPASTGESGDDGATGPGMGSTAGPTSGSGGDPTGGGETGDPPQNAGYGRCDGPDPANPCGVGAQCLVIEGLDGSFCAPPCGAQCPPAVEGSATAACVLGPDITMPPINCALLCQLGMGQCPTGMTCVDAGQDGVCLWQ